MKRPTATKRPKQRARGAKDSRRTPKAEERQRGGEPEVSEHAPEVATAAAEEARPREGDGFPIVGIGASAGGLEALEAFLRHVPERSGLAFVIVQHLDPTRKGVMVELLQRASRMPVLQVKDELRVEPDRVYVIPPNHDMSILHRVLHLAPQTAPRGLNLPIDGFFRSLAEDQQDRSIGVVLSGMGSDGSLGLRAIKEKAGAAFVQEPSSAKFDGMPRSAIDAGLADVVAPVEELPGRIIAYGQHTPRLAAEEPAAPQTEKARSALEKVFILLRSHTGNDFSLYKRSTVYRRVERRMGLHQIDKLANYVRFLKENPKEIELLFKELLIGVTSFFRDAAAWEHLGRDLMPTLLAEHREGSVLRAWVAGCSTGEEAYSLAIVCKEALERLETARAGSVSACRCRGGWSSSTAGSSRPRARGWERVPSSWCACRSRPIGPRRRLAPAAPSRYLRRGACSSSRTTSTRRTRSARCSGSTGTRWRSPAAARRGSRRHVAKPPRLEELERILAEAPRASAPPAPAH